MVEGNYIMLLIIFMTFLILILTGVVLYQRKNFKKFFGKIGKIDEVVQETERKRMNELHLLLENRRAELLQEQEELRKKLYQDIENLKDSLTSDVYKEETKARMILSEHQAEIQKKIEELNNEFTHLVAQKNADIQLIESTLKDLKDKQENTIKALKEEQELKNEVDFRRILLTIEDVEDIAQLKKVEKLVHNKDVLRKLIYKTYIEVPMINMFGRLEIGNDPGIYKIQNINDKKVYIGQSVNVKNRLRDHIKSAVGISTIANQLVHEAMAEEGIENFTFHLIDKCGRDKLNDREKYWIDYYKSNEWGYNRTKGGS